MNKFIKSLQFIYKPRYWIKLYPYCPILDKKINNLLNQGIKFTNIHEHTADLGDLKNVWIASYPYGFGRIYLKYKYQPSRLTIKRMQKVLAESLFNIKKVL